MNALIISINSIEELTGGGLYFRTLYGDFKNKYEVLDVFCKSTHSDSSSLYISKNTKVYRVRKNIFFDIISRLLLCPTFLGAHFFKLFKIALGYDVIHFHSSRNIPLAFVLHYVFGKKVFVHFDNIEYKLSWTMIGFNSAFFLRFIDALLLYLWENSIVRTSAISRSYITAEDKKFLGEHQGFIIPVKVKFVERLNLQQIYKFRCDQKHKIKIIFVASFTHHPNIDAYRKIIEIAKNCRLRHCEFIVAGRDANKLVNIGVSDNVTIHSDISYEQLCKFYINSHICLSLVTSGGGMKTKVAEALAFNLPVVATSHSLIGYDRLDKELLVNRADVDINIIESIVELSSFYDGSRFDEFQKLWKIFKDEYSVR